MLEILQIIIINYAPLCMHGQVVVVVYFYVKHPVMSYRHKQETDTISISYIFSYCLRGQHISADLSNHRALSQHNK